MRSLFEIGMPSTIEENNRNKVFKMKEVLVIGGGILGASAAYHLARAGVNVVIVDREDKGQATDAAAGIICPWLSQRRNKAWYALAKAGAAYYGELIERLTEDGETETGYSKVGALSIHTDMDKLQKMEKRAQERKTAAPEMGNIHLLAQKETTQLFPLLSNTFSSVHVDGAARVDGRALRLALLNGARKHGAQYVRGHADLLLVDGKAKGVLVNGERFDASTIIVATGAWASSFMKPLGFDVQVTSQKAQIAHVRLEKTETDEWPVVIPPNDQYMLTFEEGRLVVGSTHEEACDFSVLPTVAGVHEVLDKALTIAPGIGEAVFEEVRVGYRPYTPGFLPIIGHVPNHENIIFANGLGASGLTVGPFLGKQISHIVLGEEMDIDLACYRVEETFGVTV